MYRASHCASCTARRLPATSRRPQGDLKATPVARCGRPRRRRSADAVGAARHAGAVAGESERVSGALRTSTTSTATTHASVPTQSSKCSSRSRSSARARARVLLHHGPFILTRDRRRRNVSASARRRGGRPTPSPRRRAGGPVCSSWWPRQLAGVEGDAYDFAPSRPRGRRSSPRCRI